MRKHKKFNELYPYTYIIFDILHDKYYYGLRVANVTNKKTPAKCPLEDLGHFYHTSAGKQANNLKERFQINPSQFIIYFHYTFDSIKDAYRYEKLVTDRLKLNTNWYNIK